MRLTGTTRFWLSVATLLALLLAGSASMASSPATPASGATSNESMPLGIPNSLFSGRPNSDAPPSSLMSMLDPRSSEIVRVLLALGVVVALLLLLRWIIRRGSGLLPGTSRPQGLLQVHARYPMGRGHHLVLLQVGARMLLVHQSAGRMQTLTEFKDADELMDLHDRLEESGRGSRDARRSLRNMLEHGSGDEQGAGEVVDLTRTRGGLGWRRLIGWRTAP